MGGVLGYGAACRPPQAIHVIAGRQRPAAWSVTPAVRVDLARRGALARIMRELRPGVVVHAACVSRAADCEERPDLARAVNVDAVAELLDGAAAASGFVVYISTEQVFDGTAERYYEDSPVCPRTVYGRTKAAAEALVLAAGGAVVRLPLLLGPAVAPGRAGADQAVVDASRAGRSLSLFTDELRTPVAAELVAPVLWRIARRRLPGIFHLAGAEVVSRFQLGERACAAADVAPSFRGSKASCFDGPPRSLRLVLDTARARKEVGWEPPDLRQSLARTFAAPVRGVGNPGPQR
jgi:dTDP-4-dehydrorhamnose reductase